MMELQKKEVIKDNDLNTEQVQTPIKSTGQDTKVNETTDNTGNNSNEYLGEESTLEQEHKKILVFQKVLLLLK